MEMTISNFRNQKSVNVELPDDFADDVNDIRIVYGLDQYKLVSTKSEEDKKREKAAVEFGEEAYNDLYAQYPNFGKEGDSVTKEQMAAVIKTKLESYGEKYSVLINDKNPDQLISGLVSAYANYCNVRAKMEEEDRIIKETQLDDNVFFDYIKRFIAAFEKAKSINEVHQAIVKLHQYAGIDKRELFGYTFIFKCLSPFYDKIKEIETELEGMEPKVSLKDHPMFNDEKYWSELPQKAVVNAVINNLKDLEIKYRTWMNDNSIAPEKMFEVYSEPFIKHYNNLKTVTDAMSAYVMSIADKTGKIENINAEQSEQISKHCNKINNEYREMLADLAENRVKFNLSSNKWTDRNKFTIINANFGLVDFWAQTVQEVKQNEKTQTIRKMVDQLDIHAKILTKVNKNEIDAADLVNGKYSTEELVKIANEPSK